ncbi:polyhydroxyalkanoic acid system family protein [Spongiibacter sp.]|uniref:polyhydroxyalkanoic acid system family protein n=1 Tax=Spongiibacter sp. TaxID=2024860 RepID=UPI0035621BD8
MSTISLSQRHSKSEADVREMLEALAKKLDERYQLKARWLSERELELKRSGIQGVLQLLEGEVKVDIRLGMVMKPFKSKIRDELSRAMAEKLA